MTSLAAISPLQYGMLLFLLRIALVIVRLPVLKLVTKGPDAWIALLIGTIIGNGLLWLVHLQAAQQPKLTPVQRMERAFGPVAGRVLGAAYVLFFVWDNMVSIRMYSGLLVSQPMPETPNEVFLLMLLFGAAYTAVRGPEVIARVGQFVAPLIAAGIAIVLFSGLNQMNPASLRPVLGYGWWQVLRAALFPTTVHVETVAAFMVAPLVRNPKAMVRAGVLGSVLAGLVTTVSAVGLIMFYGAPRTQRLTFPLYDMARSTTIADFFERIDALFMFTWTASTFVKTALVLWAGAYGLSQLLRVKDCRSLVSPLALLTGLLSLRTYANQAEIRILTAPQVYPFIAAPFLIFFPALLMIAEAVRRPGEKAL